MFFLALLLRLAYIAEIEEGPLFAEPAVDARTYTEHAARIAAGNWLGSGEGPFWQPPLYPYLLATATWLSPDGLFHSVRYAQALWGALLCVLLYFMGRRLFHQRTGLIAGLAAAAYGPFLFFDGELLPASLAAGLDTLALALLLHCERRPSAAGFGIAGVVIGLAALAVPTVLLFAAACTGWLALRRRRRHAAAFLLGVGLAIAPVTLRNLAVGGDAVIISYNSGIYFYIGNNSRYEETVAIRPGWEWDALAARPRQAGLERPSRQSAYFWAEAWREIRCAPAAYLRLLARKLFLLGHGDEIGRNQPIYFHRNESSLLAALLWKHGGVAFPFGVVGPLALSGLLLALRNRRAPLLSLYIILYGAGVIAFFITARYRLPMVPVLLLFATHAAHWTAKALSRRRWTAAGVVLGTTGLFAAAANYRVAPMDMEGAAAIHFNIGDALVRQGRPWGARQALTRAVRLDSTHWQAWLNLGTLKVRGGDPRGALPVFRRVAHGAPGRLESWMNLAGTHMLLGEWEEAAGAYRRAVQAAPDAHHPYGGLLRALMMAGQPDRAREVLEDAVERFPGRARSFREASARLEAGRSGGVR